MALSRLSAEFWRGLIAVAITLALCSIVLLAHAAPAKAQEGFPFTSSAEVSAAAPAAKPARVHRRRHHAAHFSLDRFSQQIAAQIPSPNSYFEKSAMIVRARISSAMTAAEDQLKADGVAAIHLRYAAAAMVANAWAESNLIPTKIHDHNTGFGIYGARLDRKHLMLRWLDEHGYSRDSLEGQMRQMCVSATEDPRYAATRRALMSADAGSIRHVVLIVRSNFEAAGIPRDRARYRGAELALAVDGGAAAAAIFAAYHSDHHQYRHHHHHHHRTT
jgi:Phage tail lysozyme